MLADEPLDNPRHHGYCGRGGTLTRWNFTLEHQTLSLRQSNCDPEDGTSRGWHSCQSPLRCLNGMLAVQIDDEANRNVLVHTTDGEELK